MHPTAELWRNQRGGIRHVKARYAATSVHIKCDQILNTPLNDGTKSDRLSISPALSEKKMQSCQAPKG